MLLSREFEQDILAEFLESDKPEFMAIYGRRRIGKTFLIREFFKNKKIVLFLDEFPWMATKRSRLLQNLDYYWNQYWSQDKRIKLIICGSSASWIINKIINNKGGLHNRITRQILLEPLNLYATKQFAQIDLLFDRDDDAITLCEIEYTDDPFVIDKQYAQKIKNKIDVFGKITRTHKQLFFAMISASGINPSIYSAALIDGVVTLDDLFKKEDS